MKPIEEAVTNATGDVRAIELTTPADWKDLIWAFGLKLKTASGETFETVLHGSGVQSVLAYNMLHSIDTSFSGSFGWRKGAIWALEEPESFLHARLQAELARSLATYSQADPMQIFLTTHAPSFLGASEHGLAITKEAERATTVRVVERAELIRLAQQSGAAAYSHPLHTGPLKPVLLVEGKLDRDLVNRAYRVAGIVSPYEALALEDVEENLTGGEDQILAYLRHNQSAIQARPLASPIIVVLDWEVQDAKVAVGSALLESHSTSLCTKWPESLRNHELSPRWVGIEAFLSTPFIEEAADELELNLTTPAIGSHAPWRYDIDRSVLKARKPAVHRLLSERDEPSDVGPLVDALGWLTSHVSDAPQLL